MLDCVLDQVHPALSDSLSPAHEAAATASHLQTVNRQPEKQLMSTQNEGASQ